MSVTATGPVGSTAWPQAVLFDLDGTLIDSVPDLAAATNELLDGDGLAPLTVDAVRSMIGNGVKKLVERAYQAASKPLAGETLVEATNRMMAIYGGHLTRHTTLMTDAAETVSAFRRAGAKIGVVTNKPEALTHELLNHFGLDDKVDVVVGGDTGPKRKPSPDMLHHAVAVLGLNAGQAVMVGDSPADIDAAKTAGMASVAVEGGYTDVPVEDLGADRVIANLGELAAAIATLKPPIEETL